jgi:hypothetical protein
MDFTKQITKINEVVMNYPKHRLGKDIVVRLAPQVGVMECEFRHLLRAFGQPTFSTESGDDFDGVEKVAWHVEFETGHVAKISDVRPFGIHDLDYRSIKEWKVNAHTNEPYEWIKEKIRDANPMG